MANWNDPNMAASGFPGSASAMDQAVDAGLRSYMLSVYNYMGSGVLLTGIVAMLAYNSGFTASMIGSPLMWVVALAPLAFVMVLSFGINKLSTAAGAGSGSTGTAARPAAMPRCWATRQRARAC